ncbi:MAG: alpha/beta fold hydrolase [Elainellaceae cyanobacterium]
MQGDSLEPDLTRLTVPTLLVYGQDDPLIPTRRDRLSRQLAAAQLQIIDRCGQLPQIEQPLALSEVLCQFLLP